MRPASQVMRLDRMGAAFPSRLSFARRLLRHLSARKANVERGQWAIDKNGYGRAQFHAFVGDRTYTLCCFSQYLAPEKRTDRVIATAWDAAFILFDGHPSDADMDRLHAQAPLQEAGRYRETDLVVSRANKSLRMFEHTVERLSNGKQPDQELVVDIGYLMRTTAVYANGKFGAADRGLIADRDEFTAPFQAEMLTVFLIRHFTHELAEHVAKCRSPDTAVGLDPSAKRHLGVGNATGLGMAPFLVAHPPLLHQWVQAREGALDDIRKREHASAGEIHAYSVELKRMDVHLNEWRVDDDEYTSRTEVLRRDIQKLREQITNWTSLPERPWDAIYTLSLALSVDAQELVVSTLIDANPSIADAWAERMSTRQVSQLSPMRDTHVLKQAIRDHFAWALETDFETASGQHQFWYVSEEKLEPRLGVRKDEPGADKELPLAIGREVLALFETLTEQESNKVPTDPETTDKRDTPLSVAEFLLKHPEHRYAVRRVQTAARFPYAEIHDNLIGAQCRPIDMLRFKLAFFGATKFDPKSDRWTRITLFQGAPLVSEVNHNPPADWAFPTFGDRS